MSVFVVIIQDHHADVAVEVWTEREAAITRARELARATAIFPEDYHEMTILGWEFYAKYSCEGDSVRVVKAVLQQPLEVNK